MITGKRCIEKREGIGEKGGRGRGRGGEKKREGGRGGGEEREGIREKGGRGRGRGGEGK